jgi:hypothetical protein
MRTLSAAALAGLLLATVSTSGCSPDVRVVEVVVTTAPEVRVVQVEVPSPAQIKVVEVTTTPTPIPPTATPGPPTATPTPAPPSALLEPMNYQPQTHNNCGPCSIAILLGYYDYWITQGKVNEVIAPGPSLCDIIDYVGRYRLEARAYIASSSSSSRDPIRQLLANGIPVIVSQRLWTDSNIGHYRVIKGYDDVAGEFISDDPLQSKGRDFHIPYDVFDSLSRRGGAFIPVYPPEMDTLVRSLMRDFRIFELYYCPSG